VRTPRIETKSFNPSQRRGPPLEFRLLRNKGAPLEFRLQAVGWRGQSGASQAQRCGLLKVPNERYGNFAPQSSAGPDTAG